MPQSFARLLVSTVAIAVLAACGGTDGAGSNTQLTRPDPAALGTERSPGHGRAAARAGRSPPLIHL